MTTIHVIMLSRLDRNEGGRETWVYNFLPLLLMRNANLVLKIFGIREAESESVEQELKSTLDGETANRFQSHQFPVANRRLPVFFEMWYSLWRHTRSPDYERPNYVMGMGIFELVMMLTGRFTGCRKIVWLRGIFLHEKAGRYPSFLFPILCRIEVAMLRRADFLMANGEDIADYYRGFGLNIAVIENGVDIPRWRSEPPRLEEPIRVAYIARLSKVKGIEEFLQVVRCVKGGPEASRFEFHIVGDGSYKESKAFLDNQTMFKYHGNVENVLLPAILSRLDVCVAFTQVGRSCGGGGTSNALLEQMASGRVIIAWDNPHFRQVLDNSCAYMVAQNDVGGVVKVLCGILADRRTAASKSSNASVVARRYSLDAQVERCSDLIDTNFSLARPCLERSDTSGEEVGGDRNSKVQSSD